MIFTTEICVNICYVSELLSYTLVGGGKEPDKWGTNFFFLLGKNGCRILHTHLKERESFFEFNKPHREKHVSVRKNKTRSHDNDQEMWDTFFQFCGTWAVLNYWDVSKHM